MSHYRDNKLQGRSGTYSELGMCSVMSFKVCMQSVIVAVPMPKMGNLLAMPPRYVVVVSHVMVVVKNH